EAFDDRSRLLPVAGFLLELLPSGTREPVVLRLAVVLGGPPVGRDVALLLELQQGVVERAVIDREKVAARLLDAARNPVAVKGAHRLEGLQHHQRQSALPDVSFVAHDAAISYREPIGQGRPCGWRSSKCGSKGLSISNSQPPTPKERATAE